MKKVPCDRNKRPEHIGGILRRTLRDLFLRSNQLRKLKRRHSMDDRFDDFDGPDWEDWMIIGPLSEDIAREKRDIERTRREWDDEDDDYWKWINKRW